MRELKERSKFLEANQKRHECNQRFLKAEVSQIKKKYKKPQTLLKVFRYQIISFVNRGIIKHFKVNYSTINMPIQQVQLNQMH